MNTRYFLDIEVFLYNFSRSMLRSLYAVFILSIIGTIVIYGLRIGNEDQIFMVVFGEEFTTKGIFVTGAFAYLFLTAFVKMFALGLTNSLDFIFLEEAENTI